MPSGTAIAIHPVLYPDGSKDGFFPHETVVVQDILADCEGVVRWGGDEKVSMESHFQVDVPPATRGSPPSPGSLNSGTALREPAPEANLWLRQK